MSINDKNLIGKVSATQNNPTTCDSFQFWLKTDIRLSPFDIVKVDNPSDGSITYGMIQDIFHISDGPDHISNYVSSDFGDPSRNYVQKRLSLSYVKADVIYNTKENYMPVFEGAKVYTADAEDIKIALGLNSINDAMSIPAGLMKTSNNANVPIPFDSNFLIGPEGAHLNISGISGLATKTSYIMFLLKTIQYKFSEKVAIIVFNVKGDDLLHLHQPNRKIKPQQKNDWDSFGIPCEPFKNVTYLYPYSDSKAKAFSNTTLPIKELRQQLDSNLAKNYVYTFENDKSKLDMLFSNVDDPNFTIESILNYIETNGYFKSDLKWKEFTDKLKQFVNNDASATVKTKEIPIASWRRFYRLINNLIKDDVFQDSTAAEEDGIRTSLSDEICNLQSGQVKVVDIGGLKEQLQCLVFGDVIQSVYKLKHGFTDRDNVPEKIIIFVDELNKYAPTTSAKNSPLLADLLEITERGRSEGVILFSAEQFRSAVHDRVKGNCSTNIYGRTNAIEVSKSDYRYVPKVYSNMMTRLSKGDLIIQHPIFKTMLKIQFPFPSYNQGGSK